MTLVEYNRVHLDLWYAVPPTNGGHRHGKLTVRRSPDRPTEVLDLTSLTLAEFQPLVSPFDAAFQAHMADCSGRAKARLISGFTSCSWFCKRRCTRCGTPPPGL